ncbi:hypothetical protein P43SY_010314 [Pythium insidiosum]|uniref:C5orf34-like C-terminal domain-containing protein n=1 Tax=Pythium insidiosum TaxID=114742 RepID=A0AAD5LWN1_PYTIN|nr:hypothetical protein P43SY_010314 [Pythium insidiosum]
MQCISREDARDHHPPRTRGLVEAPRLQRAVLLRDGTAVALFSRKESTSILVLEPHGHSFTFVAPDGKQTRHLTPTARSSEVDMVDALLQFRNRFIVAAVASSAPRPYLLEPSLRRRRRLVQRQHPQSGALPWIAHGGAARFRRARWPLGRFQTQTLWNEELAVFQLTSIEGTARVQLHASGRVIYAQFYAAFSAKGERGRAQSVPHALVEQTFTLSAVPSCFAAAVLVLRMARRAHATGQEVFECSCDDACVDLPSDCSVDASPTFRPLVSSGDADVASVAQLVQWIRSPASRALDKLIAVELIHDVCFVVEPSDDRAASVLVLSLSPSSDAAADAVDRAGERPQWVLACQQRYVQVFRPDGVTQQQFTADTVPLRLEGFGRDDPMSVADSPSPPLPPASEESTNSAVAVEDVRTKAGRFRAFNGGSTRVVFPDRTILHVEPNGTCHFVHPDGSTSQSTTGSVAAELRHYVDAALDFAEWAFSTPEERYARHRRRQEHKARVALELQRIAVQSRLNQCVESSTEPPSCDEALERSTLSVDALHDATRQHIQQINAMLEALACDGKETEETNEAFHSSSISSR